MSLQQCIYQFNLHSLYFLLMNLDNIIIVLDTAHSIVICPPAFDVTSEILPKL